MNAPRTIAERALDFVQDGMLLGLGSGRAARNFVEALGKHKAETGIDVTGVATSEVTAALATKLGIPLLTLEQAMKKGDRPLDIAFDGADEVDPNLDMIKGAGRAMIREMIVEAAAQRLVILVGKDKLVNRLGEHGVLPVEVVPFGMPLCERRLRALGCEPVLYKKDGQIFVTENGNHLFDCKIPLLDDARQWESDIKAIPGVVGTGLFLDMADIVLVGDQDKNFQLLEEKQSKR